MMSPRESEIRSSLSLAMHELKSAMHRMPDPELVFSSRDLAEAVAIFDEGQRALSEADRLRGELALLDDVTEEGALLASNARLAVSMIRHSLALVCAELDMRASA